MTGKGKYERFNFLDFKSYTETEHVLKISTALTLNALHTDIVRLVVSDWAWTKFQIVCIQYQFHLDLEFLVINILSLEISFQVLFYGACSTCSRELRISSSRHQDLWYRAIKYSHFIVFCYNYLDVKLEISRVLHIPIGLALFIIYTCH